MQILSFYPRFINDIKSLKKTITIRDEHEVNFKPNQLVHAVTFPDSKPFGTLRIESIMTISFAELNSFHAKQENMQLDDLKILIKQIYPKLPQLYIIEFTYLP